MHKAKITPENNKTERTKHWAKTTKKKGRRCVRTKRGEKAQI